MRGMIDYDLATRRQAHRRPRRRFHSVLARGEAGRVHPPPGAGQHVVVVAGRPRNDNQPAVQRHARAAEPSRPMGPARQDPAARAKAATRMSALRLTVKSIQRIASEDVEMRGKLLRKHDRVRWFISSANRDPEAFPDPETTDIARHPASTSRSSSGTHHCLGATLSACRETGSLQGTSRTFPQTAHNNARPGVYPSITFRSLEIPVNRLALVSHRVYAAPPPPLVRGFQRRYYRQPLTKWSHHAAEAARLGRPNGCRQRDVRNHRHKVSG